jgi:hypothetical protein
MVHDSKKTRIAKWEITGDIRCHHKSLFTLVAVCWELIAKTENDHALPPKKNAPALLKRMPLHHTAAPETESLGYPGPM